MTRKENKTGKDDKGDCPELFGSHIFAGRIYLGPETPHHPKISDKDTEKTGKIKNNPSDPKEN